MAEGTRMMIDNLNHEYALDCMSETTYSRVSLVFRDDCSNSIPLGDVVRLIKQKTMVHAKFVDSWYNPVSPGKDLARLQLMRRNYRIYFEKIYGYFDRHGLTWVPRTVSDLGLAIGNTGDSRAISDLITWPNLCILRVSVRPHMPVEFLYPLPAVEATGICIPHLNATSVNRVAPIICALVPQKRLDVLYLPKCDLTYESACTLADQLRHEGISTEHAVAMENVGSWQPTKEQKIALQIKFPYLLREPSDEGRWHMNWIYS